MHLALILAATLNHVEIAVSDMAVARRAFVAAGFYVSKESPISPGFTHAFVPFTDGSYLELLCASRRTFEDADVYDALKAHDVMAGAGFAVPDVHAERSILVHRGFRMARVMESPHWSTLAFAEPAGVMENFFYIAYRIDGKRYMHQHYGALLLHSNGALGLRRIDVVVKRGSRAQPLFDFAGLSAARAIETGRGNDPRITRITIATSSKNLAEKTAVVEGARIYFTKRI